MTKTVICMVGLSNSGKTTVAKAIERELHYTTVTIINRDTLRLALYNGRYDPGREQEINQLEELYVKAAFLYGYQFIIIDACHHTKSSRWRWAEICQRAGWELIFRVLDTPVEECLRRAEAKGDDYIVEVIKQQAEEADFWEGL